MTLDKANFNSVDVYNPILGSGIEVPRMFWKPGTSASYNHHVGKTSVTGLWQGTLMAGMNPDSPFSYLGSPGNINLHWPSLTTYYGDHIVIGRSTVLGIGFRTAVASATMGAVGPSKVISGSTAKVIAPRVTIGGAFVNIAAPPFGILIGGRNWAAATAYWDSKKSFDIPHPSKTNHRLRYICTESPKADVYVRGRLKGENIIKLPDYWKDLVDADSITVQLQPIGQTQNLVIQEFDNEKIVIVEKGNIDFITDESIIDCFYHVYGERKDTTKNISEYEGLTPDDYPGDNREYVINGGKR